MLCICYSVSYILFFIIYKGGREIVMSEVKSVKIKKLTNKQIELIKLAYNFRFITSKQVALYFKQDYLSAANSQLAKLTQLGYLARHHDGKYKIIGRSAEYYLTLKSIPILKEQSCDISELELKRIYVRSKTSARFIDCSLVIFDIYLNLKRTYDNKLGFLAKPQLNAEIFECFPKPLPDGLVTIDNGIKKVQYFLEYFDDAVTIGIHSRKLLRLIRYRRSNDWKDTVSSDFPGLMIVCQSKAMFKRAEKRVRYLEKQYYSDISYRLISLDELTELNSANEMAWIEPIKEEKVAI